MKFGNSNVTFSSISVTSLVLSNGTGSLTGTGKFSESNTIYNFLVTGSQTNNTIRIQITDPNNNSVIYDTQPGNSATAAPTTPVTGANGNGKGHVIAG